MLLATIFEEHCDSLKSIFRLLHNKKKGRFTTSQFIVKKDMPKEKNKEKIMLYRFQETDFRVLAQGGQRNDEN